MPDKKSPQRRILIAMDGSLYSRRALEWYSEFLDRPGDYLVFVYVAEPPPVGVGDGIGMIRSAELFQKRLEAMVERARQMATLLDEKCVQLGISRPYKFVECFASNVGAAIISLAEQESVSLILMGNRGANSLRRTFLGSVSSYVLHHSSIAVIIAPLKPEPRNSLASTDTSWTASTGSQLSIATLSADDSIDDDGAIASTANARAC
uniref:Usp domain-containing protein n=2 Tax=Macrostomum lignano TaxID=282301 RepID=A0A1I8IC20_9PLAT